jgi:hypothetical protein
MEGVMPKGNLRSNRKKSLSRKPNLTTLSINSTDTAAFYGLESFGAHEVRGPSSAPKWSEVVTNPRAFRKKGEISR